LKDVLEEKKGFFVDFETLALMKKALEETFASGADVIIATMAKPCGRKTCLEIMQKARSKEEALNQLCVLVNERNWADLSFFDVDFEKGLGKAIVKGSFEARKTMSKASRCTFLANFLAGFIAELFTKNVLVEEVKCAGKGDDHCEFRF
jgi:predicted hydrocarbon binding protein